MVKKCCIKFYKSESYAACGISFHSFPKDEGSKQKWLILFQYHKELQKTVVCSRYFKKEDFYTANSRQLLKTDVIPSIFPVVQNKDLRVPEDQSSDSHEEEQLDALMYYINSITMSDYKMNILYYIAGHFVNKMLDKISCKHCRDALVIAKEHYDHTYFVDITNFSSFTAFIDKDGLKYVSRFAFEVIKHAEKLFLPEVALGSLRNISKNKILLILNQFFLTKLNNLFDSSHPVESYEEPHELQLVKT